jgi:hypothetical protein
MIPLSDDNPTAIRPVVTIVLIAAASAVFLWQVMLPTDREVLYVYALGVIPATLLGSEQLPPEMYVIPPWVTILTSMFLHGGWLHLIGNMLYLWIFGNNIEDALGHVGFVLFYVACGAAAALTQSALDPDSTVPMIGASGAIAGVSAGSSPASCSSFCSHGTLRCLDGRPAGRGDKSSECRALHRIRPSAIIGREDRRGRAPSHADRYRRERLAAAFGTGAPGIAAALRRGVQGRICAEPGGPAGFAVARSL